MPSHPHDCPQCRCHLDEVDPEIERLTDQWIDAETKLTQARKDLARSEARLEAALRVVEAAREYDRVFKSRSDPRVPVHTVVADLKRTRLAIVEAVHAFDVGETR